MSKKRNESYGTKHTEPVPSERPKITPELMIADRKIGVTILEKRYDNPKISGADLKKIKNQITRLKEEIESINVTVGLNEADSKRQKEIAKRMGYLDLSASSYHKEPEEEFFADAKNNQPWYKKDTQK
ncbi:hypothetical protein GWK90_02500 [Candidatus Hamiltonella defensa]|uniref:hypothetical protein n=1 Tax=Candidatus Williamhamiltonella defendens TaxID=138072 RepID=UPI000F5079ED|nr:hypothetical protein [Candidatus Hamiltonella defensa]MBK4361163.1 hypothetical protein [Candidatus Hamiltonella defensa]